MKRLVLIPIMVFAVAGIFCAIDGFKVALPGDKKNCIPPYPLPVSEYASWTMVDRNDDGTGDYAFRQDKKGNMIAEAMDYNADGLMDDFYMYEKGILVLRCVDSNYDGKVDLWAYMDQGVYVRAWEKDEDYDGIIDKSRCFDS